MISVRKCLTETKPTAWLNEPSIEAPFCIPTQQNTHIAANTYPQTAIVYSELCTESTLSAPLNLEEQHQQHLAFEKGLSKAETFNLYLASPLKPL